MKNTWLRKNKDRKKVEFTLSNGKKIHLHPDDIKDWYNLPLGAGGMIVLKNGRKWFVKEMGAAIRDKLSK